MAPVGLKHWMLHNGQLANEYDETLKLSPGYDPVRAVDPALTFHAPLLTGPDSIPGAIRAIFERNSEATYRAPRGVYLLNAPDDQLRHEYSSADRPLGALLEPAITNKCTNWNANPDAALEHVVPVIGIGTVERINQRAALKTAGLDAICTEGNVIRIEETDGGGAYAVRVDGEVGNLNDHTLQIYARVIQGEGRLDLTGGGSPFTSFTNTELELIRLTKTPTSTAAALQVRAQPGSIVEFVLNQLEQGEIPSSIIVTKGAATSRALDQLSWPLMGSLGPILNQTEGMAAFVWKPSTNKDAWSNGLRAILSLDLSALNLMFLNNDVGVFELRSTDGSTSASVAFPGNHVSPGVDYVLALRWGNGNFQVGIKATGAWSWGATPAYDGAFPIDDRLHLLPTKDASSHARHLALWNVDRGTNWLESFFGEVAN